MRREPKGNSDSLKELFMENDLCCGRFVNEYFRTACVLFGVSWPKIFGCVGVGNFIEDK